MKIVVSFTTIPNRVSQIKPTVDSLLNQSLTPDVIYLHKAEEYLRAKGEFVVPKFIEESSIVVNTCVDFGPFTKLAGSLLIEKDPSTIIITCDDDVVYPPDWLERLVNNYRREPGRAWGYRGRYFIDDRKMYSNTRVAYKENRFVDIITGTWGALYRRGWFDNDIFEMNDKDAHFADDILISGYLNKKGVRKKVIPINVINPHETLPTEAHNIEGLEVINPNSHHNDNLIKKFWN